MAKFNKLQISKGVQRTHQVGAAIQSLFFQFSFYSQVVRPYFHFLWIQSLPRFRIGWLEAWHCVHQPGTVVLQLFCLNKHQQIQIHRKHVYTYTIYLERGGVRVYQIRREVGGKWSILELGKEVRERVPPERGVNGSSASHRRHAWRTKPLAEEWEEEAEAHGIWFFARSFASKLWHRVRELHKSENAKASEGGVVLWFGLGQVLRLC